MVGPILQLELSIGDSIGTFYNAALGVNYQARIEEWAQKNVPEVWQECVAGGFLEDQMGMRLVRGIKRMVRA